MTEPNNGVSLQNNGKKEKRGYKKKAFTFYIYFSDMSGRQVAKNWILGYHNASGIFKLTGRILNGCQKGLKNITSSYGDHEKNIKFITSGRRPRVINLIFSSDYHNYE